jgi:hypothetical protein
MLGNFLLGYWNPFEFVCFHYARNQPEFHVERRKEYLNGINQKNVLGTVFSWLISLPWFPVTLDVIFG